MKSSKKYNRIYENIWTKIRHVALQRIEIILKIIQSRSKNINHIKIRDNHSYFITYMYTCESHRV